MTSSDTYGPRDFRQQLVEPGDRAVYVTTGRYAVRAIVEVLEVKTKVKVRPLKQDRYGGLSEEGFWAEAGSLFLVERFKGEW